MKRDDPSAPDDAVVIPAPSGVPMTAREFERAGRVRRKVFEALARTHPGQLHVSTRRGQPRPRPLGRPVFSPWLDWHWRSMESHVALAQRVPVRAVAQFARQRWRALSMTGLANLAKLSELESLRVLSVARRNRARALGHLARIPALTDLRFGSWSRPCAGFEKDDLEFLQGLPRLTVLALWGCDAALDPLRTVAALRDLRLTGAVLTPARLGALGKLASLEILDLGRCAGLDDRGAVRLTELRGLRQLGLSSTEPGPAVLEAIGDLSELELLDLRAGRLLDAGVDDDGLARLGGLTNLTHLDLWGNRRITDAGARTLGRLRRLTWLNLSGCHISDVGLAHLHALTGLRFLELGVSTVSDRAIDELRRSLADGDPEIRRTTLREYGDRLDRHG